MFSFSRNVLLLGKPLISNNFKRSNRIVLSSSTPLNYSTTSHTTTTTPTTTNNNHKDSMKGQQPPSYLSPLPQNKVTTSFLVHNYTAPVLASAFQDRERILQKCATALANNNIEQAQSLLRPFLESENTSTDYEEINSSLTDAFKPPHLRLIKKRLSRLPRQISRASQKRAAVIVPLCLVNEEPHVLFTLRSRTVGKHKGEVCFPGGMVDTDVDQSIVETCLREMQEEVGVEPNSVDVLGILRCDWHQIEAITGVAVTPIVGFLSNSSSIEINPDEVQECFTIPLVELVNPNNWTLKEYSAPIFTLEKDKEESVVIWGLTGYILHYCIHDIVLPIERRKTP